MNSELLFSYGTLQQEDVQRAAFGRKLNGMRDALPGWRQELVEITDPDVLAKSGERFHPIVVPGWYSGPSGRNGIRNHACGAGSRGPV